MKKFMMSTLFLLFMTSANAGPQYWSCWSGTSPANWCFGGQSPSEEMAEDALCNTCTNTTNVTCMHVYGSQFEYFEFDGCL